MCCIFVSVRLSACVKSFEILHAVKRENKYCTERSSYIVNKSHQMCRQNDPNMSKRKLGNGTRSKEKAVILGPIKEYIYLKYTCVSIYAQFDPTFLLRILKLKTLKTIRGTKL